MSKSIWVCEYQYESGNWVPAPIIAGAVKKKAAKEWLDVNVIKDLHKHFRFRRYVPATKKDKS